MTLNDPTLVAQLARLHDDYEAALVANDVDALMAFFWDSSHVVRFGVAEQLYGSEELRRYRQGDVPRLDNRRLVRRVICTFGADTATVMSEMEWLADGVTRRNRQAQTWIRLPGTGWRIVAAHVSRALPAAASAWEGYVDAAARALDLSPGRWRQGIVANLERTAAIAAPLLAVEIPDEIEPAPVFTP